MTFLRCEAGLNKLYCFRLSHTCPPAKNVCSRDLELNKDTPLFATSDGPLLLIKAGAIDSLNPCMMNVRWRFYHFWNRKYRRRSSRSWFHGVAALPSASDRATATSAWQVGSSRAFIWPRIISRLHFSLTFLTKVKRFSNVFCEVDIAIVVQKSHCPLILC